MTTRHRLLAAFAAANLLLIVAGWFMLVAPQRQAAAATAAQEQAVQTELAALSGTSGPTKQPAIHTSDLYALDTALPSQEDQPDMLFELDRLTKASGVAILGISPQAGLGTSTGYTVVPINLQLSGSYFHLTDFLHRLRMLVTRQHGRLIANGPLFAVTSVTLAPGSKKGEELASVGVATFYYGTVAGATAPPVVDTTTTNTTGG